MQTEWSNEWVLSGTHAKAKDTLKRALRAQSLEICFDLDLGAQVCRRSGVRLAKTSVLGVTCPFLLLEGLVSGTNAALFLPLHVAVAEYRGEVLVSILSSQAVRTSGIGPAIAIPLHKTLVRLSQALESAGARRTIGTETGFHEEIPAELHMEEVPSR